MEPTQSGSDKLDPDKHLVNRRRRFNYIATLTGALMSTALTFAWVYPDHAISKTIVESSYDIVAVIVVSYLASSSVDYTGVLTRVPGLRRNKYIGDEPTGGNTNAG